MHESFCGKSIQRCHSPNLHFSQYFALNIGWFWGRWAKVNMPKIFVVIEQCCHTCIGNTPYICYHYSIKNCCITWQRPVQVAAELILGSSQISVIYDDRFTHHSLHTMMAGWVIIYLCKSSILWACLILF